jgi:hypothetical protein
MRECAFCSHVGKLTNEHVISQWLAKLFPGKITSRRKVADEMVENIGNAIDYKAKTVCKACNEGWMSALENERAKPVLTPLVIGKQNIPITPEDAHSIALFAFSKAVVIDTSARHREQFFPRSVRHAFRKHQRIPGFVNMYFCPFAGNRPNGRVRAIYSEGKFTNGQSFEMYVCTFAFGHFAFQVVALKRETFSQPFECRSVFREGVAVPLWPEIPSNYIWPHNLALMSGEEFDTFARRWETITI